MTKLSPVRPSHLVHLLVALLMVALVLGAVYVLPMAL